MTSQSAECVARPPGSLRALPWNLMVSLMISSVSATALYSPTFTSFLSVENERQRPVSWGPRLVSGGSHGPWLSTVSPSFHTVSPVRITKLATVLGWHLSRCPQCRIPQDGKPISTKGTLPDRPSFLLNGDFPCLVGFISGQQGLLLPLSQDNLGDRGHRQTIPLMPAPRSPELYSISPGLHPQSPEDPDK